MSQQFAFVLTDSFARIPVPGHAIVRRHCARHKNKRSGSRRSRREAARAAAAEQLQKSEEQPEELRPTIIGEFSSRKDIVSRSELLTSQRSRQGFKEIVAPAPPSDWALFPFAETLDIFSQRLMHRYFMRNPIRDTLYPFKHFGIQLDFGEDPMWCFQMLCSDQLYFRAMLLLNSASEDLVLRQPLSKTTYGHLRGILPILNRRLSQAHVYNHDMILYVISVLAATAIAFKDYTAAKTHAKGLSEIIRLRLSSGAITLSPVIQFSIDRLNFSSLLATELWTSVYGSSIWEPPVFPTELTELYATNCMFYVDGLVEPDLAVLFYKLQCTTLLFNKHYYSQTPIDGTFIQQCLGFIHYSLIELKGRLKKRISKCLRLGMMAFIATTYRLPDMHKQQYCSNIIDEFYLSYATAKTATPALTRTIDIWLIFMLTISAGGWGDIDVSASWESVAAPGLSWDDTRGYLKQVMWIDTFHDDLGRIAFDAFMSRTKR
ncbi:hypothetical protein BX600DRAFT_470463 [Xylariales sp. PMI_506]|nr:hypothetical protein BX600DRAFT_470463 [Xylariales sp. PMI_506]